MVPFQYPPMSRQNFMGSSLSSPPDSGRIRCVCEYDEDDGFTIQCEQCLVWQHAKCVGISKNSVPEQYFCEECNPGWHEDLHNLAFRAINLDVITTNNPLNVNIIEDSTGNGGLNLSAPATRSFKRKICMPPGVPALNEITENIISNDAQPIIDSFLKGLNIPRLRRQQNAQDPNLINFEFQSTVVLDSSEHLALLQKNLEIREIRSRGYQKKGSSTKYGLFATEICDPGHFVCEFIGHIQVKNLLTVKGAREFPVPVTQSFVLYPFSSIDLAVDARKFGTPVRYSRRSCRPNVQIKPVIIESPNGDPQLSWGLFARNVIRANSEILLPLDYQCGNCLFRYECACNSPDFCLGPLDTNFNFSSNMNIYKEPSSNIPATFTVRPASPKAIAVDSTELEALGIRRSSSIVLQDAQNSLTNATRPILDTRKLSREERKLQKYIEYFEKMDNADAAKKVTTSSSNTSIGSISRRGGSVSSGSSPQPSNSRISSPEKAGGLKKAWKNLFSNSGGEGEVASSMESKESIVETAAVAKTTTNPVGGKKRGRKPSVKPQSMEPLSESNEQDNSIKIKPQTQIQAESPSSQTNPSSTTSATALKSKSPPKRKKGSSTEVVAIVDDEDGQVINNEEIDVGSEVSVGGELANKKVKLEKIKKIGSVKNQKIMVNDSSSVIETSPLIDIERSSSVLNNNSDISNNLNEYPPPSEQASIAVPDTPSKKKLSLSDYLKKKKASPSGSNQLNFDEEEEEGEIQMTDTTNAMNNTVNSMNNMINTVNNMNYMTNLKNIKSASNDIGNFLGNPVLRQKSGLEDGEVLSEEFVEGNYRDLHRKSNLLEYENSSSREFLRNSIGEITNLSSQSIDENRSGNSSIVSVNRNDRDWDRDREIRDSRDRDKDRERDIKERDVREYRDHRDYNSREYFNNYKSTRPPISYPSHSQHPPQMLSQPSAPISRYRDERDKEFDRIQREREFERREAERERERKERMERERLDRDPRDSRDFQSNHPNYHSSNRFYHHNGRGGYRPPFQPRPPPPHTNPNPNTNRNYPETNNEQQQSNRFPSGYQRPPNYKNYKYNHN